jgi:hypothetical protein
MGQNISTRNEEDNNLQTNIEIFLQDMLEKDYVCDDLNDDNSIKLVQGHITRILNKTSHEQLVIFYKQMNEESMKHEREISCSMNELIKYYTKKIIATVCIYSTRIKLMKLISNIKETDINSINVMNRLVKMVHILDDMAKQVTEEIIQTSSTSDGKIRKRKYYRERQLTKKQLDEIMRKLKSF